MKKTIQRLMTAGMLLGLSTAALAGNDGTLQAGDPAPAISVAEWVKGDAADTLAKGEIYLIEFWATW